VMESSYSISWAPGVSLKHKVFDENGNIAVSENGNSINLVSKNLLALEPESHSPSFDSFAPHVFFSMDTFYLEGVQGVAHNWDQFGKWIHNSLLNDVSELPPATVTKVRNMVNGDYTLEEKTRLIYEYVQKNTRYISVQIGIGGWKPMPATEVDNVGYGDCKALTNYTRTLLKAADIPSYYTVVYASAEKRNILHDFPSLQGNHVILAVPNEDETIWLECTSQDIPFGFLGDFTDDRDVLMVTPEGGKIAHTEDYDHNTNYLITKGNCSLDVDGNISVTARMESSGIQYDDRYKVIEAKKDKQDKHYKNYWNYIDNISISEMEFVNDREAVMLKESLEFDARSYAGFAGNDMLLNVNILNRSTYIPKKYKNRQRALSLPRGFKDVDEVVIELPEGYAVKTLPEPIKFEGDFGKYSSEVVVKESGDLIYKRTFEIHEGDFPKESYDAYRKFRRKVAKSDNQKLILSKI
ncbi:MAG: transglutaminase domain-containing protein, partial [Flavobacteriaceae bacterium]|nr:transglutaminase domain-containing protein [Flavobacteriaceae bacterium]